MRSSGSLAGGRPVSHADVAERIASVGIVPVLVLESADLAVPVCEALLAGGVSTAEVTFRTPDAAQAIARIREALPQMLLGAGTLLSGDDVRRAHDAGAAFGVAPGLREAVVQAAQGIGLPLFPGVCTPGDIERGLALGLDVLKLFPAAHSAVRARSVPCSGRTATQVCGSCRPAG